jgi:hypothetical protein
MDFRRFNPLCPQKTHYGALFLDEANARIVPRLGHDHFFPALYQFRYHPPIPSYVV